MFQNDWMLAELAKERRRDLERELEQYRLVHLARSTRGRRSWRFDRIFAGLGQMLITLGGQLQARHRALLSDAALHAAHRSQSAIRTQRD